MMWKPNERGWKHQSGAIYPIGPCADCGIIHTLHYSWLDRHWRCVACYIHGIVRDRGVLPGRHLLRRTDA